MKFRENPFRGSRVVPCGQTDIHDEVKSCFCEILRKCLKESLDSDYYSSETQRLTELAAMRLGEISDVCRRFTYGTFRGHYYVEVTWKKECKVTFNDGSIVISGCFVVKMKLLFENIFQIICNCRRILHVFCVL